MENLENKLKVSDTSLQLAMLGSLLGGIYDDKQQIAQKLESMLADKHEIDDEHVCQLIDSTASLLIKQDLALHTNQYDSEAAITTYYGGTSSGRLLKTDMAIIRSAEEVLMGDAACDITDLHSDDWQNSCKKVLALDGNVFAIQGFEVQENLIGLSEVVVQKNGCVVDLDAVIDKENYLEQMLVKMLVCQYFGQNYYNSRAQINYTTRMMISILSEQSSPKTMKVCELLRETSLDAAKVLNATSEELLPICRKALLWLNDSKQPASGWRSRDDAIKFISVRFSCGSELAEDVYNILKSVSSDYATLSTAQSYMEA